MIPHTVSFFLGKNKDGVTGRLRMRVRWCGRSADFNLGHCVELDKWSGDSQRAKANTSHGRKKVPASRINADIQEYERLAGEAFLRFKTTPSAVEYRSELSALLGRPSVPDSPPLRLVYAEFIHRESVLRSWSAGTRLLQSEVMRSLDRFAPDTPLSSFDGRMFESFYLWMAEDMDYANRTLRQRVMSTKAFLRWAQDSGYRIGEGALGFVPKIKTMQKTIVWLDWEELQSLLRFRDSESLRPAWRDVLDGFLLSCFTGLRASDVRNLRWSDVDDRYIRVVTQKTSVPLFIDLNKYSRMIVGWHRDDPRCVEFVMPRVSNTPVTLKRICRDAGIVSPVSVSEFRRGSERVDSVVRKCDAVSMHTGRRTFICNALSLGITHQTIMKWTGHKDYESMWPYIDISSADKEAAMGLFDSK